MKNLCEWCADMAEVEGMSWAIGERAEGTCETCDHPATVVMEREDEKVMILA